MPSSILEAARRADEFFMAISPIHETMRRLVAEKFCELWRAAQTIDDY